MGRVVGLGVVLLFLPGRTATPVERYNLGQRLRAFVRAWDDRPDAAARQGHRYPSPAGRRSASPAPGSW
jgi:hypothetical protein